MGCLFIAEISEFVMYYGCELPSLLMNLNEEHFNQVTQPGSLIVDCKLMPCLALVFEEISENAD